MRKLKLGIAISFLILGFESSGSSQEIRDRPGRRFDEFSSLQCEDTKARLDNFAISMQNDSNAQGFIIVYGGRRGKRGEAHAWMNFARGYLTDLRGLPKQNLAVIDGGYRQLLTMELWLLPKGESPPTATPTIQPKDVRFKRGRIQVKYICMDE